MATIGTQFKYFKSRKIQDQENVGVYKKSTVTLPTKKVGLGIALGDLDTNQRVQNANNEKNASIATLAAKKTTKSIQSGSYKYVQSKVDSGLTNKPTLKREESTAGLAAKAAIQTKCILKKVESKIADEIRKNVKDRKIKNKNTKTSSTATKKQEQSHGFDLACISHEKLRTISPRVPSKVKDIDDRDGGRIELMSEYVKDIYAYLTILELEYPIESDFMSKQTEATPRMRAKLIDWMVDVHTQFCLLLETLHLTVALLDRYLQVQNVPRNELQLLGVTCMLVASKYEEIYPPDVDDFVYVTDHAYSREEVLRCERQLLRTLGFSLARPLPLTFLRRFIKVAHGTAKHHHLAKYLVELSLVEYATAHRRPSELAAAAICLSLHLVGGAALSRVWMPSLAYYSGYELPQIESLVYQMARVVLAAPGSSLQAVRDKYAKKSLAGVSQLPQLSGPAIQLLAKSDAISDTVP